VPCDFVKAVSMREACRLRSVQEKSLNQRMMRLNAGG
jgi:hypothetical protein